MHRVSRGVFPGHKHLAWQTPPRPPLRQCIIKPTGYARRKSVLGSARFFPTLDPCTTSCSVLEHRRVPHTSADGQRVLLSTSFRRSGVLQRARAAPPATDLPLDAAQTGDATPRESPAACAPPARPAPAGQQTGWDTIARGGGG